MSTNAAFANVQRGGLKLKPKAAAALVRAVAAASPPNGAGSALISGAKRRIGEVTGGAEADGSTSIRRTEAAEIEAGQTSTFSATATVATTAASISTGAATSSASAPAPAPAPAPASGPLVHDRRTPAQRAHDEAMARRRDEIAAKAASKSHRQRVDELNHLLATAPEHFDLPRISFAGQG